MLGFTWQQLRGSWLRSLVLLVTIVVAVTSFSLLSATVSSSQLTARTTLDASFQPTYDILVRPADSRTEYETSQGMVRPNFLSGIFGGITLSQWDKVKRIPGVEVAAPIEMIGQIAGETYLPVDITDLLTGDQPQLFRYRTTIASMNGLATTDGEWGYIYLTPNKIAYASPSSKQYDSWQVETLADGKTKNVCTIVDHRDHPGYFQSAFSARTRFSPICATTASGRAIITVPYRLPALIAAIDPTEEAKLTGINTAIDRGRYLAAGEPYRFEQSSGLETPRVPIIAPDRTSLAEQQNIQIDRLDPSTLNKLASTTPTSVPDLIAGAAGTLAKTKVIKVADAYANFVKDVGPDARSFTALNLWTTGPTRYTIDSQRVLHPVPVTNSDGVWTSAPASTGYTIVPASADDTGFRTLSTRATTSTIVNNRFPAVSGALVGTYDPSKLMASNQLAAVPMEVYAPPSVTGADPASRKALGGKALLPNSNPAGYLQQPPTYLTSIQAAEQFFDPQNYTGASFRAEPISVIRVRVAGVTGANDLSRERVRAVASAIMKETGLDVDITAGSSPAPQQVALPAMKSGAPALLVDEGWAKKGTDLIITKALDRKSLALFILILIVCVLAIGNAVAAQTASRAGSYAVLMCTGWSRPAIGRLVVTETVTLGLAAGLISAIIVPIAGAVTGVGVHPSTIAFVIGLSIVVSLAAAALPAWRATRLSPLQVIRAKAGVAVRLPRARHVPGIGAAQLLRHPGRMLLSVLALATAVASIVFLTAIQIGFRGQSSGTLLGEAVTLQVKGQDVAAVVIMAILALFAVQDNLYVSIMADKNSYACLIATGWTKAAIARLVATQAMVIALIAGAIGSAVGAIALTRFTGSSAGLTVAVSATLAGAVLICAACTIVPARKATGGSIAQILADDEG